MLTDSDLAEVHWGTRKDLTSKRMTQKRDQYYKLIGKRDDLLTKLCRVHLELRKLQKSMARLEAAKQKGTR